MRAKKPCMCTVSGYRISDGYFRAPRVGLRYWRILFSTEKIWHKTIRERKNDSKKSRQFSGSFYFRCSFTLLIFHRDPIRPSSCSLMNLFKTVRSEYFKQGCKFTSPKFHLGEGEVKVKTFHLTSPHLKFSKIRFHPFSPFGWV